MTDPTPQAEQRVCKWCLRTIVPPTNEMPYWSERIKFLGWHCLSQEGPGKHEPAEPSPAPPAQIERPKREQVFTVGGLVRVMYDASEVDDYLADRSSKAESALAAAGENEIQAWKDVELMREERDQYKESFNLECDRREGCLDQLTTMREERDRDRDALRGYREHHDTYGSCRIEPTGDRRCKDCRRADSALKPVSDRQPEGETKCQIE